jgi:hypothetical protein
MKDFLELVRAIAWPAVVVASLAAFYAPLVAFLEELGKRATKISAFHVEIEFPALAEAHLAPLAAEVLRAMRQGNELTSSIMALLDQLRSEGPMDYAVIDLGDGKQWLTSRLYIFALILERLRGLRCLVFVATSHGEPRRFLGTGTPGALRWALARRFPWLECAFATAYQSIVTSQPENPPFIRSNSGAMDTGLTTTLILKFLESLQSKTEKEGWIPLSSPGSWERAEWMDKSRAESYLREVLGRSWVIGNADRPKSEVLDAIIRCEGEFVALLEPSERFLRLVDRYSVVEQLAERR